MRPSQPEQDLALNRLDQLVKQHKTNRPPTAVNLCRHGRFAAEFGQIAFVDRNAEHHAVAFITVSLDHAVDLHDGSDELAFGMRR